MAPLTKLVKTEQEDQKLKLMLDSRLQTHHQPREENQVLQHPPNRPEEELTPTKKIV